MHHTYKYNDKTNVSTVFPSPIGSWSSSRGRSIYIRTTSVLSPRSTSRHNHSRLTPRYLTITIFTASQQKSWLRVITHTGPRCRHSSLSKLCSVSCLQDICLLCIPLITFVLIFPVYTMVNTRVFSGSLILISKKMSSNWIPLGTLV